MSPKALRPTTHVHHLFVSTKCSNVTLRMHLCLDTTETCYLSMKTERQNIQVCCPIRPLTAIEGLEVSTHRIKICVFGSHAPELLRYMLVRLPLVYYTRTHKYSWESKSVVQDKGMFRSFSRRTKPQLAMTCDEISERCMLNDDFLSVGIACVPTLNIQEHVSHHT